MSDEADRPNKTTTAEERWARLTDEEKAMIEETLRRHRGVYEELAKR